MQKKLTITVSEEVYAGLYRHLGPRKISSFIEHLVRPYVVSREMDAAYAEMARDQTREREALEWAEGLAADAVNDSR